MKNAQIALKLVLPVAFFGYAAYANFDLLQEKSIELATTDLLRGGVTGEIDTLYRDNLPHKEPSVGVIGAMRYALLGEGRDGVVVGRDNWLFTAEEFRLSDAAPVSVEETVARMAQIKASLESSGSLLVVVPLPAKVDIERDRLRETDVAARNQSEFEAFLARLNAAGLETIDSRAAYEGDPGARRFFRTDTHWTPQTAERVAMHIASVGKIAPGETVYERQAAGPEVFHGDLVSFVTSDNLAPVVGLTTEQATPFRAVAPEETDSLGAIDLFGSDETGEVVLVGTSYSANPIWSFAEALKIALGRDVINFAEEGQGPVRPMQAFLASADEMLEAAPEVVLWEFPVRYLTDPTLWDGPASEARSDA